MGRDARLLLQNFIVGGLALLLPWRLAFLLIRFLTRFGLGALPNEEQACDQLLAHGFALPRRLVIRHMRLHRLMDLADFYKSHAMSKSWLRKYWRTTGDALPDAQKHPAVLFVTFHYGAGFWALRHFHEQGLSMAALYRPPPTPRAGLYWDYFFFWRRLKSIRRLSGAEPIRVGDERSELTALVRRLARDRLPLGVMPDIPTPADQGVAVTVLGRQLYFARALLRLVVKQQVPVVLYTATPDLTDGGRDLEFKVLYEHASVAALAATLGQTLEQALLKDPTAWHLWAFAGQILHNQTEH